MTGTTSRLTLGVITLFALIVAACGGGGHDATPTVPATATETALPSATALPPDDTATVPPADVVTPPAGKPALLVQDDDGSATFEFSAWDATLTVPADALPPGISLDDITVASMDVDGDSPLLAHFRFGPDGIVFEEPVLLVFTLPLRETDFLAGLIVSADGNAISVFPLDEPGPIVERLTEDSVRILLQLGHFSDYLFFDLTTERAEIFLESTYSQRTVSGPAARVIKIPLAVAYPVGGGGRAEILFEMQDFELRTIGNIENVSLLGDRLGTISGSGTRDTRDSGYTWGIWSPRGPIEFSELTEYDALDIQRGNLAETTRRSDADIIEGSGTLGMSFVCKSAGEFSIELRLFASLPIVVEYTARRVASDGTVFGPVESVGTSTFALTTVQASEFWLSECVAPGASASPVSDSAEDDDDSDSEGDDESEDDGETGDDDDPADDGEPGDDDEPADDGDPVDDDDPGDADEPPEPNPLEQAVGERLSNPAPFDANFSNGSCAQYPAGYSQTLTIQCDGSACTLREGGHVDPGNINFATGAFVLENPGVERYEGFMTLVGALLVIDGDYTFFPGNDTCTWEFSGIEQ